MTGTLKARVGGAWVPILGSGQDAANTARWNSAWGQMGSAQLTSTFTTTAPHTTSQTMGLSVTVTETAGRRLMITVNNIPYPSGGLQAILLTLRRNGAVIDNMYLPGEATSASAAISMTHVTPFAAVGGTATYDVYMAGVAANTAVSDYATATSPRSITVEDIGPVTPASIAPPEAGPRVVASGNALGIVAMGAMISMTGANLSADTLTDITSPLSFTPLVGRRYRLVCRGVRAVTPTGGASGAKLSVITTGITSPAGGEWWTWLAGSYDSMDIEWVFDGTGQASTFKVAFRCAVTVGIYTENPAVCQFYIEDVGPNTTPALPIPATDPPWNALPFTNGWTNYGAPWTTGGYRKIGDWVTVRGLVRQPTAVGGSQQLALLPVGFRPPGDLMFMVYGNNVGGASAGARLDVTAAGAIMHWAPGGTTIVDYCSISNVQFSTTA